MRNLYRPLRMIAVASAAALLLLVVAAGAAQAQSLLSTGTVYFRPGTTVPYYNYVLPRTDYSYTVYPRSILRFNRIADTLVAGPLKPLARIELRREIRVAEKLAAPAKRSAVW